MSEPRRFVILTHDHPVLHWDLMIEVGDSLRTWRLGQPPQVGTRIAAMALSDHRRGYLDYEGPVSGGRGTVERWDAGTCAEFRESPNAVTAVLHGERIQGKISLHPTHDIERWWFLLLPSASGTMSNGATG